ncbi:MAG: PilT/PilU family type 4a pilus ATPase [Verrucomicrobia bacterium]|nr:PilT/PilU family type 4a pilus ATPase [Verrucomicrobiota bacterium]
MNIEHLIVSAADQGASDLHLEPTLPPAIRIRGKLRISGKPLNNSQLSNDARQLIGEDQWANFIERGSFDLSRSIQGIRCRINILKTARGIGFAVRLFNAFEATLKRLNLNPELRSLIESQHGLVVVSGPTGSGKSSTLAALVHEINLTESRHIVTVESPIEYRFRPRQSYIRQREVGRDTPSFQQALMDSLREDPDVIMVGEMRDPETIRLTLNAAETGHLVLVTVHSSNTIEAIQRIVSAFPAEAQNAISAQLADCLVGVVAQRLRYRDDIKMRLPECEILRSNHAVKAHLRSGELFKLKSALETGADHGMWTFERYNRWLSQRKEFYTSDQAKRERSTETSSDETEEPPVSEPFKNVTTERLLQTKRVKVARPGRTHGGAIEIEPGVSDLGRILRPNSDNES